MKTLHPSHVCSWLLADIIRKIAKFTQVFISYCLDPICITTLAIRTKALTSMIAATAPLRRTTEYQSLIGDFPEKLFQLRMESILKLDWDMVDAFLVTTFAAEEMPVSRSLTHDVLRKLQRKSSDKELRVRASFILKTFSQGIVEFALVISSHRSASNGLSVA